MLNAIPSTLFTYDAKTRVMVTEESTIRECTVGSSTASIAIRSDRTGDIVKFDLMQTMKDADGDVMFWVYKNTNVDVKIHVYND